MRVIFYFYSLLLSIPAIAQADFKAHISPDLHLTGEGEAIRIDGIHRWINFVANNKQNGFLCHNNENMYLSNLKYGHLYLRTNGENRISILPTGDVEFNKSIILSDNDIPGVEGMIRWNEDKNDFEGYTKSGWVSLTVCSITICDREQHQSRIEKLEAIVSRQNQQIKTFAVQLKILEKEMVIPVKSDNPILQGEAIKNQKLNTSKGGNAMI